MHHDGVVVRRASANEGARSGHCTQGAEDVHLAGTERGVGGAGLDTAFTAAADRRAEGVVVRLVEEHGARAVVAADGQRADDDVGGAGQDRIRSGDGGEGEDRGRSVVRAEAVSATGGTRHEAGLAEGDLGTSPEGVAGVGLGSLRTEEESAVADGAHGQRRGVGAFDAELGVGGGRVGEGRDIRLRYSCAKAQNRERPSRAEGGQLARGEVGGCFHADRALRVDLEGAGADRRGGTGGRGVAETEGALVHVNTASVGAGVVVIPQGAAAGLHHVEAGSLVGDCLDGEVGADAKGGRAGEVHRVEQRRVGVPRGAGQGLTADVQGREGDHLGATGGDAIHAEGGIAGDGDGVAAAKGVGAGGGIASRIHADVQGSTREGDRASAEVVEGRVDGAVRGRRGRCGIGLHGAGGDDEATAGGPASRRHDAALTEEEGALVAFRHHRAAADDRSSKSQVGAAADKVEIGKACRSEVRGAADAEGEVVAAGDGERLPLVARGAAEGEIRENGLTRGGVGSGSDVRIDALHDGTRREGDTVLEGRGSIGDVTCIRLELEQGGRPVHEDCAIHTTDIGGGVACGDERFTQR